jgi:hypothetical protein
MIKPLDAADYKAGLFSVLDIETYRTGKVISIMLVWKSEKGKYHKHIFSGWIEFLDFVIASPKNKYLKRIYAHNGAGFDWLSLVHEVGDSLPGLEIVTDGGGKGIGLTIRLAHNRPKVHLRDSLRILPASLSKLSKAFGVKQPKLDLDGVHPEDLYRDNIELYYQYLEHDCFALLEILEKYEQEVNQNIAPIGELRMTIGAMALAAWRTMLDRPIMTAWNKNLKEFTRASYVGGRTEVFRAGVFDSIVSYDVNSMYPFVMAEHEYPVSYVGRWSKKFDPKGLYHVRYTQTNRAIPALLHNQRKEYSYQGEGVFWSWELSRLRDIGGRFTIIKGYIFEYWGNIFSEYQNKLYRLRKDAETAGDGAKVLIYKLFANSLYGKFAQKPFSSQYKKITSAKDTISTSERRVTVIRGDICEVKTAKKVEHEFTAISSAVTSRARMVLYDYLLKAGQNLIYCDTDSIHVDAAASPKFTPHVSKQLGKLKIEKEGMGAYAGKKLYAVLGIDHREYISSKGIPKGKLSFDDIRAVSERNKTIRVDFDTPATLKEVLSGKQACKWYPRHRTIRKTFGLKIPDSTENLLPFLL